MEGGHVECKIMVGPSTAWRVETHPALRGGVGFVDSAREKNKARAVVERPLFI